jgi:hypothetical protein
MLCKHVKYKRCKNNRKKARGPHEPVSLTWERRIIELLHIVEYRYV